VVCQLAPLRRCLREQTHPGELAIIELMWRWRFPKPTLAASMRGLERGCPSTFGSR
jgi:hypothetical protein